MQPDFPPLFLEKVCKYLYLSKCVCVSVCVCSVHACVCLLYVAVEDGYNSNRFAAKEIVEKLSLGVCVGVEKSETTTAAAFASHYLEIEVRDK